MSFRQRLQRAVDRGSLKFPLHLNARNTAAMMAMPAYSVAGCPSVPYTRFAFAGKEIVPHAK